MENRMLSVNGLGAATTFGASSGTSMLIPVVDIFAVADGQVATMLLQSDGAPMQPLASVKPMVKPPIPMTRLLNETVVPGGIVTTLLV